jgi:hypothetical protein
MSHESDGEGFAPPAETLCKDHLQRYDPARESGCPQCCGEPPAAAEDASQPWGKLIVGMVAVLAIGTLFLGSGSDPEDPAAEQRLERLKAGPFKQEIEKLEWILYADGSEGVSDAKELVFLAGKLAHEIREWESRLHMTVYIGDIKGFGRWVEQRAQSGFDDRALAEARQEWERVRAKVFEPEPWFARW